MDMLKIMQEAIKPMQNEKDKNGITVAVMGGSGHGKSTLLRKIFIDGLYSSKDHIVQVFTLSEHSNAFKNMSKNVIVDGNGVDVDTINFMYKMNCAYDKTYNFVAILDDCIHIRNVNMIEKMFLIMRNSNITSIVSLQYMKLIPVSIRNSVYFAICMGFNGEAGDEHCVQNYIWGYLPGNNLREKVYHYKQWVQGYRFFLLDNLNHKCYKVDENYKCEEIFLIQNEKYEHEYSSSSKTKKKRRKMDDSDDEEHAASEDHDDTENSYSFQ